MDDGRLIDDGTPRCTSHFNFNHDLPSDPGYDHPGYIDVILPASSLKSQVNDSLATPDLSDRCSPQRRRRRRPLVTTPSYHIELYDYEQLIPVKITSVGQNCEFPSAKKRRIANVLQRAQRECCMADDSESSSFSGLKSPCDAFRQYVERYRPVKIRDVALFREDKCTTTAARTNKSAGGRPVPVVALSTDLHSLPPQILDTVITVQCAFYPSPSSSSTTSINDNISDKHQSIFPHTAQEIDLFLSSSCANKTVTQQCIVPTFMGQEDQVTTEMTLGEAIKWSSNASSTMAVCVAQLPIVAADEERSAKDGDDDQHGNDYDDNHRSVHLRLDGTVEDCMSKYVSTGDDVPMSQLSSMLRLPSYLLLGNSNFDEGERGSHNYNNIIVIRSVNLWHAPQVCCTNVHYDDHDNLLIVTEGTKTVELCPPGCIRGSGIYSEHANHPALLRNVNNDRKEREGEKVLSEIDGTLNLKHNRTHIVSVCAGEALYIPQGWWHRVESTHSSANEGCTAINVWFDYRHSSRSHNIPRHMMPFQLRRVARQYYEMNADHASHVFLEKKRRQSINVRFASNVDVLEDMRSISVNFPESLLRGARFCSVSDVAPCCKIFSDSWARLMKDCDPLDELTTVETTNASVNRFRNQLEYFLLRLNLIDAGQVQALVQMWLTFPLPSKPILRVNSNNFFAKLILELSPESCYIITQAWERHSSNAKDGDNQAEKSFKYFFQLAGSTEFVDKVRRYLALGVEEFKWVICHIVLLDRELLGRV